MGTQTYSRARTRSDPRTTGAALDAAAQTRILQVRGLSSLQNGSARGTLLRASDLQCARVQDRQISSPTRACRQFKQHGPRMSLRRREISARSNPALLPGSRWSDHGNEDVSIYQLARRALYPRPLATSAASRRRGWLFWPRLQILQCSRRDHGGTND